MFCWKGKSQKIYFAEKKLFNITETLKHKHNILYVGGIIVYTKFSPMIEQSKQVDV